MFKKELKVKGSTLEYTGSDNIVERINSTQTLQDDVEVLVSIMMLLTHDLLLYIIHIIYCRCAEPFEPIYQLVKTPVAFITGEHCHFVNLLKHELLLLIM